MATTRLAQWGGPKRDVTAQAGATTRLAFWGGVMRDYRAAATGSVSGSGGSTAAITPEQLGFDALGAH